nr:XRE family transcriptional regulator [uncultured Rhodoferax sp.]
MPRKIATPENFPQAVIQQIELLAQNIVIARKRRNESQAQWAKKLGVSQPTMARIERGDPSVAMVSYAMCVWLINPAASVADLIAPLNDHGALEREIAKIRPRKTVAKQVPGPAPVPTSIPARNTLRAGLADLLRGNKPEEVQAARRSTAGRKST